MTDRIHVGTRKGLFELARRNGAWEVVDAQFLGDPVSAVLAHGASHVVHFGMWVGTSYGQP